MRFKKTKMKAVAALILALLMVVIPTDFSSLKTSAATISELEDEKATLDEKLAELQGDIDKQQEYLDTIKAQINNIQSQIDTMNSDITSYNEQITEIETQIADKQAAIDANFELLKKRLRAIYMSGEASTLAIILDCNSIMDFAEKSEFMKNITEHDAQLMNELSAQISEISGEKAKIEEYRNSITEDKKALESSSTELSGLYDEANAVMQDLNLQKTDMDAEAYGLEEEIAAEQERQEQAAAESGGGSGGSGSSGSDGSGSDGGSYVGTGSFIWPCPGFTWLSSYWGDGRNHKGIDIAGSGIYGAPIVAADSGVVTWAVGSGWGQGYGLSVFIDHQNGYSTRYAHMSNMIVSYGEYVTQGQIIGYVGSTGDSSGPHLHFEVRVDGTAVDPMQYYS